MFQNMLDVQDNHNNRLVSQKDKVVIEVIKVLKKNKTIKVLKIALI